MGVSMGAPLRPQERAAAAAEPLPRERAAAELLLRERAAEAELLLREQAVEVRQQQHVWRGLCPRRARPRLAPCVCCPPQAVARALALALALAPPPPLACLSLPGGDRIALPLVRMYQGLAPQAPLSISVPSIWPRRRL